MVVITARNGGADQVDHPFRPVEAAPQVIVLAIGAAEEGAEIEEFGASQRCRRAAFADGGTVFRTDAIDLHRVEFGQAFIAHQRQGGDVVEREAEVSEQHPPPQVARHGFQRRHQHLFRSFVRRPQLAPFGQRIEEHARFLHYLGRDPGEVFAQGTAILAREVECQRLVHRIAGVLQAVVGNLGVQLPVARQAPRQQAQSAHAEDQVVVAEEFDGRFARTVAASLSQPVQTARFDFGPQVCRDHVGRGQVDPRTGRTRQFSKPLDDAAQLGLGIGMEGISRPFCRRLLRLGPPCGKALAVRPVEEQRMAEQLLHRRIHFGAQRAEHDAQLFRLARLSGQRFEVVADRLFARDAR